MSNRQSINEVDYCAAVDTLQFSEEAKSRMAGNLAAAGRQPAKRARPLRRAVVAVTAALLAVTLTIGAGAAGINISNILAFIKGKNGADIVVTSGVVDQYVETVTGISENAMEGFQISETYFDGQVLVLGIQLTIPDAPKEYRELIFDYDLSFSAEGKPLGPEYIRGLSNPVMSRVSGDTFGGQVSFYPNYTFDSAVENPVIDLPKKFDVTMKITSLTALDTQKQLYPDDVMLSDDLPPYQYEYYEISDLPEAFTCAVTKNTDLQKVYEINETKGICTVKKIAVTPAWTEVEYHTDQDWVSVPSEELITIKLYDSQGKPLDSLHMGQFYCQHFRTPDEEETHLVVKFIRNGDEENPVEEFTIPIEGGYFKR